MKKLEEREKMSNKLIVMSIDGLVREDMEEMQKSSLWKKYFSHACGIKEVRSIYPTITYPCHTTMCTGVWPEKHGVTGNLLFQPGGRNVPWKWLRENNQWEDDIFYAAKRAGKTTAAIFWPVTGNHPAIDYLIDEYWPQSEEDTPLKAFERTGSSQEVLEIIKEHIENVVIRTHPGTDDFMVRCACDFVKKFQPDLLMMHPGQVDGYRHRHGVFSQEAAKGVEEALVHLEWLMETLESEKLLDVYNVVIVSDHGLINYQKEISINALFREAGLIRITENGEWIDWDACCISGGGSAVVHLKPEVGQDIYNQVSKILYDAVKEESYGIGEVLTKEEAKERYHLNGDFAFVVETNGEIAFSEIATGDVILRNCCKACHGHQPEKGPQPVLWAVGPDFKKDIWLENGRLVDEAPTFAKVLGTQLKDADGNAIEELLQKEW